MKRVLSILICLVTVCLIFSSCEDKAFNPDKYIGESLVTQFSILVDANQNFYNDVFVLGHLEIDEEATFEKDGITYAPVKSAIYPTYKSLVDNLKEVYTEEEANAILDNYNCYADIDGVFCYNMAFADKANKGYKWVRDPNKVPELEVKEGDTWQVEFRFTAGKKDELDEFKFIRTELGYRLVKLQYVK